MRGPGSDSASPSPGQHETPLAKESPPVVKEWRVDKVLGLTWFWLAGVRVDKG